MSKSRWLAAVVLIPGLALTACGDDDDDDDATPVTGTIPAAASIDADAPADNVVTVVATNYKFTDLPTSVPKGTKFELRNDSTDEVHEMIVIRIPDDEDRTVGQIAALTEAEQNAIFGDTEPATVIVALPGEVGQAVEGDGTVADEGRYAVVCFIPKGAPVDVIREAFESASEPTGPPDMGTGAPHIALGMYGEVTVGG